MELIKWKISEKGNKFCKLGPRIRCGRNCPNHNLIDRKKTNRLHLSIELISKDLEPQAFGWPQEMQVAVWREDPEHLQNAAIA